MTNNHKIKPRKLGHLVLAVRDIHKSVEFYTEVLGLQVSDWISDQMCFLRAGTDHHDLALSQIPKDSPDINDLPRYSRPGMEHFSYLVDSLQDMELAADMLKARGVEIVRGIGKHGPGENCFLVFKDPDGNNVELYCEMQQIALDEEHGPQVWERNIESFDQWRFARFVVPPPAAVVKDKQGKQD
ncbi:MULTISPECIES: VOC family protein [Polaromonas]|uniref:VOC family protein n=1 Tax=Polaromonas aquatica TaxID=332657 RepID=A0ABW1TZG3_9BURK